MTTTTPTHAVADSGTFRLGGNLAVHRLGFGSMRLTGEGVWGEPRDRDQAVAVLRRAVELGVTLIDTADSYGPDVAEELIHEALHPYPTDLVIATKGGLTRAGPNEWAPVGRPEYLRQCVEMSLRRLGVDRIDLYQLHRLDARVPVEESLGELGKLQGEGKIRHIGVSEVSVEELERCRDVVSVVSVQNQYNLIDRKSEAVLDRCTELEIGFIPWFPLATGGLAKPGGPLDDLARRLGHTPSQLALAWLLKRSPVILPIPGTSSLGHLEENCDAAGIKLTDDDWKELSAVG